MDRVVREDTCETTGAGEGGRSIPCGREVQVFHVKNNLTYDLRRRGVAPDQKEFAIFDPICDLSRKRLQKQFAF